MRDLLVTGTDTGVGKTLIACALISALRARGVRAVGFKPAETGVEAPNASDSQLLAAASEEHVSLAVPLLQLVEPLAPAVAAERAGIVLRPEDIESRIGQLRSDGYTVVVEGAGGALVPLSWDYNILDLAEACDLDAVVVGRAGLGTLNHLIMTVLVLQARSIAVRGIVLNGRGASPDLAESTNPAALARLLPGMRIVEVPHYPQADAVAAAARAVDRLL